VVPVTPVFHAADVVAVPSIYEPFSLVALEAAAAGVPLVLSARAGAAEHLASAAVMVDHPADPDALRRALDDLEEDPEAARRLAFQARRTAEGLHWRITAGRALEVLERVAGARAP
ncbi:MAG: glycosyltransferase, partial [Actinomycetota bacterium]